MILNSNLNHVLVMDYDASHGMNDLATFIFNNNLVESGGTFRGVLFHGSLWRYEGYSLNTAEGWCGSVYMEQYINGYPISYTYSFFKGQIFGGKSSITSLTFSGTTGSNGQIRIPILGSCKVLKITSDIVDTFAIPNYYPSINQVYAIFRYYGDLSFAANTPINVTVEYLE